MLLAVHVPPVSLAHKFGCNSCSMPGNLLVLAHHVSLQMHMHSASFLLLDCSVKFIKVCMQCWFWTTEEIRHNRSTPRLSIVYLGCCNTAEVGGVVSLNKWKLLSPILEWQPTGSFFHLLTVEMPVAACVHILPPSSLCPVWLWESEQNCSCAVNLTLHSLALVGHCMLCGAL